MLREGNFLKDEIVLWILKCREFSSRYFVMISIVWGFGAKALISVRGLFERFYYPFKYRGPWTFPSLNYYWIRAWQSIRLDHLRWFYSMEVSVEGRWWLLLCSRPLLWALKLDILRTSRELEFLAFWLIVSCLLQAEQCFIYMFPCPCGESFWIGSDSSAYVSGNAMPFSLRLLPALYSWWFFTFWAFLLSHLSSGMICRAFSLLSPQQLFVFFHFNAAVEERRCDTTAPPFICYSFF